MSSESAPFEEERSLFVRHCAGERDAFPKIFELFKKRVWTYILRMNVQPSYREDLFQEVFLKVHAGRNQYQSDRPLAPWIMKITVNTVLDHFKKHEINPTERDPELIQSSIADASQLLSAEQLTFWVNEQIAALPLPQREAIALCCFKDVQQTEGAELLGIPVATLRTNLGRARKALTEALLRREREIEREAS